MSDGNAVLCFSEDVDLLRSMVAPLEWSYPDVTVLQAETATGAIENLETRAVDTVVTDVETVQAAPAVVQATRERHPDLPVLVLAAYATEDDSGTAILEVVDFIDAVGDPSSDEAFAGCVANSVVGGGATTPPGGTRPEDIVRDVKRHLADAQSPLDIEHAVCDQLTMGGRYAFAWIGEYDRGERQVVPWVTGGADGDWPTNRTFPVGTGAETLIDGALRTREPEFSERVERDRDLIPWSDPAIERGVSAVAVAPLVEDGELHGVLGLYSDGDGFSEMERTAVREIGDSVAGVLHDMALRGRISQQERRLERYERLVETVGDGMYALDGDGHFMTVNNGLVAMTGYAREGLLGEHISVLLEDDDLAAGQSLIEEMVTEEADEPRTIETTIRRKDGSTIPCETKVAVLSDGDEFRGTVGVMRDITERKERERELERQNERLDAFAGIVSHDLRNPLGVAQGYLDLAIETGETDQLDQVVAGLDRMEEIIDDVLELAREGETVSETGPVDVRTLARDAWANVKTPEATLTVDSTATVAADRSRLMRAFENLFRNSVEHGGSAVTVRVGVEGVDGDGETTVYVADDGEGIPAGVRNALFEEEFTTSEEGLGLGLWVVREVADAHGWTVIAGESRAGGARFEFGGVDRA